MCRLASEEMHLNEHEAAKWVDGESIYSLKWLPADEDVLPLIAEELRQES
jgi:8-oxo-dGTP diphosphatase